MIDRQLVTYADIPCYVLAETGCVPRAEIFLYHGWGSNAEKQCFRGALLAGFGYRVIVPEISGHGMRGTLDYDGPEAVLDFLKVLRQSIDECIRLADAVFMPDHPHFLIGHSLGGMIVLGALAVLRDKVQGVAAMNSSAAWGDALATLQGVFAAGEDVASTLCLPEAQALRMQLAPFDPACWQADGITTPVLLTNGSLDKTLPATLNAGFLAQHNLPQVRQVVIDDAGHVVTDSALREVVAFIEMHRQDNFPGNHPQLVDNCPVL